MKNVFRTALALTLALALTSAASSAASAHEFLANKTGKFTGAADTSLRFEIAAGSAEYILCDKAHILGELHNLDTGELIIIFDYEECKAETFLGELSTEVSPAHYTFHASGSVEITEPIKINIGGIAEQTVTDQTVSSVTYSNSTPISTIMINANVTGIHSEGSFGTQTTGTYTGESLIALEGGTIEWK